MSSDKFHCTNGHCLTDCVLSSIDYGEYPPKQCPFTGIEVYWDKCKNKPTLFNRITVNEETLAEKLVYQTADEFGDVTWSSTIVPGWYVGREDCIAATVAKLKEVCDE